MGSVFDMARPRQAGVPPAPPLTFRSVATVRVIGSYLHDRTFICSRVIDWVWSGSSREPEISAAESVRRKYLKVSCPTIRAFASRLLSEALAPPRSSERIGREN